MLWTFGIVALNALFGVVAFRYVCKRLSRLEWMLTVPVKKLAEAWREQEAEVEQQMHRTYGLQPRGLAPTSRPFVPPWPLAHTTMPPDPWAHNGHNG